MRSDPEAVLAYRKALVEGGVMTQEAVDVMTDAEVVATMTKMLAALRALGDTARRFMEEAAGDGHGRKKRGFYNSLLGRLRDNPGHDA